MEFVNETQADEKLPLNPSDSKNSNDNTVHDSTSLIQEDIPGEEGDATCCVICDDPEKEAPVNRVVYPHDVMDFQPDDESIYIIGTRDGKVTQIGGLEQQTNLKTLILRSCLVSSMAGVENLIHLEKLELYDNHIEYIQSLGKLSNLRILDLSFNSIREMVDFGKYVPLLEELYLAQNKLRKIEGLTNLQHLRVLDLGANRIRTIEGLENNRELKSLWLGKNKIEAIEGLESNVNLQQLDIQNNRLTSLGKGLTTLIHLKELYLACNRIEHVYDEELPSPSSMLQTIDLSYNGVQDVSGVSRLQNTLEEFWLTSSRFASFESLSPIMQLPKLTCLYLEHSPISKDFEYRKVLAHAIPSLEQLDATLVYRLDK